MSSALTFLSSRTCEVPLTSSPRLISPALAITSAHSLAATTLSRVLTLARVKSRTRAALAPFLQVPTPEGRPLAHPAQQLQSTFPAPLALWGSLQRSLACSKKQVTSGDNLSARPAFFQVVRGASQGLSKRIILWHALHRLIVASPRHHILLLCQYINLTSLLTRRGKSDISSVPILVAFSNV